MRVVIANDSHEPEWEAFVERNNDVIGWHRYGWHRTLQAHYPMTYYPLAVCDDSAVRGILPLYKVRTWRTGEVLMSIPYVVAGGLIADGAEAARLLLGRAVELSRELGGLPVTLKQYKVKVEGDLLTEQQYYNREVDLSQGPDRIWGEIAENNRQLISELASEDLALELSDTDTGFFYDLLSRHHHAQGIPCVSRKWVQLLLASGLYRVALLRRSGIPVAGTMVKEFKGTFSCPLTCLASQDEGGQRYAFALYWQLIRRYAREHYTIFHSGRIPHNDAVVPYRLGWGGVRQAYYYQYHGRVKGPTEYAAKRGGKRATAERYWKRLPRAAANRLGPVICRQFP